MKKISKVLLCAALTGAMAVGAAGAADLGSLSPQGAREYLDLIASLQQIYGKAAVSTRYGKAWKGLSMAKLVDMDGDKIPELYCAAYSMGTYSDQFLYTYDNGSIKLLDIPNSISNFNTDVAPTSQFYVGSNKAYLLSGYEVMNGGEVNYWTKQGNNMVSALRYTDTYDWSTHEAQCSVNGQSVSESQLNATLANFTRGMSEQSYNYRIIDSSTKYSPVTKVFPCYGSAGHHHLPAQADQPDRKGFHPQGNAQRRKG